MMAGRSLGLGCQRIQFFVRKRGGFVPDAG